MSYVKKMQKTKKVTIYESMYVCLKKIRIFGKKCLCDKLRQKRNANNVDKLDLY